ncbi:MAG: PSD1 and planctomycete cytochrome C domain-containing protein [Planctomycetaceae bacterium]
MRRFFAITVSVCSAVFATSASAADGTVDYRKQIKPLLKHRCVTCHGPLRRKGGLRLDAAKFIRKGGESDSAIVPGKPDESLLVDVLTGKGGLTRMPLDGKPLKPAEIALIRRWIQQGAIAPADEKIEADPRSHWAYRPPKRPAVPTTKNGTDVRNPIDAFVAAQHERRGLKPQPPAPKHILLRRVSLDLIGIPPTPEQLRAFLADDSPNAYETVVDRLLKSPRYGERWGRHWMDVWRYSDWYGYKAQLRNSARHIWRWRDYIVESLNKDRPYDEMIVDMLAADENTPTDRDRLRATGYLARQYYLFNRDKWLDGTIEHTSKAFLGLTLNCARCHEHKFDPIEQREYYRFRAIFEPHQIRTDRVPGQPDVNKDGLAIAYDAKPDAKTYVYLRGNDKHPDKENPVTAGTPAFLGKNGFQIRPVKLPPAAWYPGLRPFIRRELLAKAETAIKAKRRLLKAAEQRLKSARQKTAAARARPVAARRPADRPKTVRKNLPRRSDPVKTANAAVRVANADLKAAESALRSLQARITADDARYTSSPPSNTKTLMAAASRAEKRALLRAAEAAVARAESGRTPLLVRKGKKKKKKKAKRASRATILAAAKKKLAAARKALKNDDGRYSRLTKTFPQTSTGRRLALARWIANRRNPLTARVAVNHIWMRHFGKPLVSSVFDFGLNGKPPTHPQLLDWLAVELMDSGWRMKHLHRLIVTSNAYRRSSSTRGADPNNLTADQDNRFLWRMNSRRMEAEIVRDSVLSIAGKLDLTMGGPERDAKLGQTTYRRSLYYRHAPEKFMPFLTIFDGANTHECYRRNKTVVPQQALAMINSRLLLEQSRRLATLLGKQAGTGENTDAAFVAALFLRVLCRTPTSTEKSTCQSFLAAQTQRLSAPKTLSTFSGGPKVKVAPSADPRLRARENLALVLLNHNEFLTIR